MKNPIVTNRQSANNTRRQKEDTAAFLARRVKQIVSDAVKGKYNCRRQDNEPGTGRPWVQTKLIRVDGILGWSAIDAFDDQNIEFSELTDETVRIAHGLRHGIFASSQAISADEPRADYLTNHVTGTASLDRLKADLAEKFDLSLVFLWEGDEIDMKIWPNCRSFQVMSAATEKDVQCVIRRLGTENDLRQAAQFGFSLKSEKTRFRHRLTKEYIDYLEECGQKFLREYLAATFDNGIAWGWSKPFHSDTNLDMSPMFQAESPMLPFEEIVVTDTFAPGEIISEATAMLTV